eukprot:SAG22_NODE_4656_length_1202_cov_26.854034_2_plen_152_part_00
MDCNELIHLISNQVSNEETTEQNKLVIQNCCKELFEKKCDRKYVRVQYYKTKWLGDRYKCPTGSCGPCGCGSCGDCRVIHPKIKCDCANQLNTTTRFRICKVMDIDSNCSHSFRPGGAEIGIAVCEKFKREKSGCYGAEKFNYNIVSIDDI